MSAPRAYSRLIALSLLYFLLTAGTFDSLGLVLPAMVAELGMSWTQAGAGFTLLGVGCGAVSLAPALLIRRIGVSLTLGLGMLLLVGGFAVLYAAGGAAAYYAGTVLLGVGFCFCGPVPGVHAVSSSFARQAMPLGAYFTIGGLGAVIGPLLYLAAQRHGVGWRGYWLGFALAALALGLLAMAMTRGMARASAVAASAADAGAREWSAAAALRRPGYWVIVAAYTGCLLVNTTTHSFAYQHLLERGLDAARVTQLISLGALIACGGSAAAGVIGGRISGRGLTLISLAALALAAGALAFGAGEPVLALWVAASGIGLGFYYVATAMLLQESFGRRANLELYSIMTLVSTSAALGPVLGGMARDANGGFAGVFAALAAIGVALIAAVAALRPPPAVHAAVPPQPPGEVGTPSLSAKG